MDSYREQVADVSVLRAPQVIDLMIDAAARNLLRQQREDGHWCAELEGDTILESEYVLLLHFLGRGKDPRVGACCARLRSQQQETGGWATWPGGPVDPSVSVKAYLCLKLAGDAPDSPRMAAARRAILEAGGLSACNSYTKLYLSIFGLWSWRRSPAVPPEMALLPRWFYFNIHEMSAWTRTIALPLSVVWALKPHVPLGTSLDELEAHGGQKRAWRRPPAGASATREAPGTRESAFAWFWSGVFRGLNGLIQLVEALGPIPRWRRRALKRVEEWLVERMEGADGLGAIFPAIVNAVIALRCLGYEESHALVQSQLRELERFEIEEAGEIRLQPCLSPVWDTALTVNALRAADMGDRAAPIQQALEWLLAREVTAPGDWQEGSLQDAPGGWCFEYRNDFYPDCDDTAEVLLVLARVRGQNAELEARRRGAAARGLRWLLGMQNPDGGWASFDRCCSKETLTLIPFADHNAMIDPSTPDITGRVVSALLAQGVEPGDQAVRRAVEFLLGQQEDDGSWTGRWGANYIYGTWLALAGLAAIAAPSGASERPCSDNPPAADLLPAIRRGRDWLLGAQNQDGGWGESLRSYDDPRTKGCGRSTASQTAWAMLGLIAAAEPPGAESRSVGEPGKPAEPGPVTAQIKTGSLGVELDQALERAVAFLLKRQREDGTWHDREWTGVGFPRVFYLRYHGYAQYFPLEALAACRRLGFSGLSNLPRRETPAASRKQAAN